MNARTYEELYEAVWQAMLVNDATALLQYAAELDVFDTEDAHALGARARGWALYYRGSFSESLEHFQRALTMYTESGNQSGMGRVHSNIGSVYTAVGSFAQSLEHHQRALGIYETLGDRTVLAGATGNIGIVYASSGQYAQALEQFYRALALHQELENPSGVANTTSNIGIALYKTNDDVKALEMYDRALTMFAELEDRTGMARVHGNIGIVYARQKRHAEALHHHVLALQHFNDIGERASIARSTANVLRLLVDTGQIADAQTLLASMDDMSVDVPDALIMREESRASLYEASGDIERAIHTLRDALSVSNEHALTAEQAHLHHRLRDLAFKQNDLANYVHHNTEHTRITEEINGKETSVRIAMQEADRRIYAERKEHEKHMAVLHSTLPKHVAERVARGEVVNDAFDNVGVLFLDVVGFTTHTSVMDAGMVVDLLQNIFTTFDAICAAHHVMKIKTIGDSYMAVAFPAEHHLADLAAVALTMQACEFTWPHTNARVQFRIGMHCGPVVAGVLGTERMQYDVWGDTVNVASRMESAGEPGKVHVTEAFASELKRNTEYTIQNSIIESENPQSHSVSHNVSHNVSHSVSHNVSHSVSHEVSDVSHEVSDVSHSVSSPLVTRHSSLVTQLVTRHSSLVTQLRGSVEIKGKGMMQTHWLEQGLM